MQEKVRKGFCTVFIYSSECPFSSFSIFYSLFNSCHIHFPFPCLYFISYFKGWDEMSGRVCWRKRTQYISSKLETRDENYSLYSVFSILSTFWSKCSFCLQQLIWFLFPIPHFPFPVHRIKNQESSVIEILMYEWILDSRLTFFLSTFTRGCWKKPFWFFFKCLPGIWNLE